MQKIHEVTRQLAWEMMNSSSSTNLSDKSSDSITNTNTSSTNDIPLKNKNEKDLNLLLRSTFLYYSEEPDDSITSEPFLTLEGLKKAILSLGNYPNSHNLYFFTTSNTSLSLFDLDLRQLEDRTNPNSITRRKSSLSIKISWEQFRVGVHKLLSSSSSSSSSISLNSSSQTMTTAMTSPTSARKSLTPSSNFNSRRKPSSPSTPIPTSVRTLPSSSTSSDIKEKKRNHHVQDDLCFLIQQLDMDWSISAEFLATSSLNQSQDQEISTSSSGKKSSSKNEKEMMLSIESLEHLLVESVSSSNLTSDEFEELMRQLGRRRDLSKMLGDILKKGSKPSSSMSSIQRTSSITGSRGKNDSSSVMITGEAPITVPDLCRHLTTIP